VVLSELNRRSETLAQSLELMAGTNVHLKQKLPKDLKDQFKSGGAQTDSSTVELLQAKIDELRQKYNDLNKQLIREQQKELSTQLSLRTYERYIANNLTVQMKDNLRKEALRRKTVELEAKRLSQKVEELEFLVGGSPKKNLPKFLERKFCGKMKKFSNFIF